MLMSQRIGRFCVRLSVISLVSGALFTLPEPDPDGVLHWKNAFVAFVAIVALGKLLFDTFFYERFHT